MTKHSGRRLLVLGGDVLSCQIVTKAQEAGAFVYVTDWYPVERSPAKQIADTPCMVSTADVDAVVRLVHEERIDGVITGFTDSVLPYYARICSRARLPCYGSEEQFVVLTDKQRYKALFERHGVPVVPTIDVAGVDSMPSGSYPLLIKPSDGSGARGVRVCAEPSELRECIDVARSHSRSGDVIIEPYVRGSELTAFYLFVDGDYRLAAVANRHMASFGHGSIGLPVGYSFPSVHGKGFANSVAGPFESALRELGVQNGMMFVQCIVADGQYMVYDVGFRLTGSLEYIPLERLTGMNALAMMIDFAFTGKMLENRLGALEAPDGYGLNMTFLARPGRIGSMLGLDRLRSLHGVLDVVPAYTVGREVPQEAAGTLAQVLVRALAVSSSPEGLMQTITSAQAVLDVRDTCGQDLLVGRLDADDVAEHVA